MLQLRHISKDYYVDKTPYPALKDVNLCFEKNEFCCILGPSGCGKTTLLNIIGGLDKYTKGDLIVDNTSTKDFLDKDWDNYRNKRIGFVFQSYNLIPHLTVLGNVEISATLSGMSKKERIKRSKDALDKVGLKGLYHKRPNQMSGGQMQRVAIARALVNNPEIILADEPTGALDSETSVQILNLLKKVAKNKLVIMVTHNDDLAKQYATRIISVLDGKIVGDTDPKLPKDTKIKKTPALLKLINEDEKKKENKKKNVKEKSSMNFFTALGISLRNLLTKKGRTTLTSIAASFGIIGVALVLAMSNGFSQYISRIESQTASTMPINIPTYNYTYKYNDEKIVQPEYPDSKEIYSYSPQVATVTINYNNFTEKYINYLKKLRDKDKLINDYLITYDDDYCFNLTTNFVDGSIKKVKNRTTQLGGSLISSFSGIPTSIFHVLFGEQKYVTETYELIDGTYPKAYNEVAIAVDKYNRLDLRALKSFGFFDSETTAEEAAKTPITFEDIYNKKFKVFNNSVFFSNETIYSETDNLGRNRNVYQYSNDDLSTLFNGSTGYELKITGVIRPKKEVSMAIMGSGICYTPELQNRMLSENNTAKVQLNLHNNFIMNKKDENNIPLNFGDFYSELLALFQSSSVSISKFNNLVDKYFSFYNHNDGRVFVNDGSNTAVEMFLDQCRNIGVDLITEKLKRNGLNGILSYITNMQTNFLLPTKYEDAYNDLLGLIAYINSYTAIDSIIVFPKDLASKKQLIAALDEYNNVNALDVNDPYHATSEAEKIYYTDIAGTLVEGLGEMINVISIVLIIFASISLVVSSVMTGIITYTSVIERTKEIGVLRAVGARKKDVGRLFEAESTIIGALAGIIGCVVAYLITIPINIIINNIYPEYNIGNIANLNIYHAILLVAISIVLTFFSGLAPAKIAAKKDPVIALRTE